MIDLKGSAKVTKIICFAEYYKERYTKGDKMCKELVSAIRKKSNNISDMPMRAKEVLDYFEIKDISNGVPIIEILAKLGIKTYQMELQPESLSAYIAVNPKYQERYGTNKITCVNKKDNIGHKRFALAHELAHYLFDFDESNDVVYYNTYSTNDTEQSDVEMRANAFAANLLMPEEQFRKLITANKKLESKADTVTLLAQYFQVSATAVLRRCQELDIGGYDI